MSQSMREWARQQEWYKCSDSRNIWSIDRNGNINRWTCASALKHWHHQNKY